MPGKPLLLGFVPGWYAQFMSSGVLKTKCTQLTSDSKQLFGLPPEFPCKLLPHPPCPYIISHATGSILFVRSSIVLFPEDYKEKCQDLSPATTNEVVVNWYGHGAVKNLHTCAYHAILDYPEYLIRTFQPVMSKQCVPMRRAILHILLLVQSLHQASVGLSKKQTVHWVSGCQSDSCLEGSNFTQAIRDKLSTSVFHYGAKHPKGWRQPVLHDPIPRDHQKCYGSTEKDVKQHEKEHNVRSKVWISQPGH